MSSKPSSRRAGRRKRPRRVLPRVPWSRLPWPKLALTAVLFAGAAVFAYRHGDMAALHAQASRLPALVAFGLLVMLPLAGVPVSILHVAAGIRFGVRLGLLLVAVSILLQLLASYAFVHAGRERFARIRWIRRLREQIPPGAHASISLVTVLLPGAPYAAINYVLPLLGVPLVTYLAVAFPLHAFRSTITVAFGGLSDELTPAGLALLLTYASLVLAGSWLTYRRIRAQLEDRPPAEGGQKQPA